MSAYTLKVGVKIDADALEKQLSSLSKKSVIETKVKFKGEDAIKTVKKYNDELGNVYTTTKVVNEEGTVLSKTTLTKVKEAVHDNTSAFAKMGKEMGETITKVLKFASATAVIMVFKQAVSDAVGIIHKFDDALTEFNKVTDFSSQEIKKLISDLNEVGATVARTTTEMVEATTEFAKSGTYTEQQLVTLARTATMYQNIADSELSAGDAASYIISQMKAFNISAEDSMQIIDKTNEVKLLLTSLNCVNFWKAKVYLYYANQKPSLY